MTSARLSRNKNGNASPKNAGSQKRTGEMYFATTETINARMRK
jgi:hypothetical protein